MEKLIQKINSAEHLSFDEASIFFEGMVDGTLTDSQIAGSLIALKLRQETDDEISALVSTLNRHKRTFSPGVPGTMDTCGTGGDGKSTVNISTAVSIILASLGCPVVKHGNTAQSGAVGSADILSELGMDLAYGGSSPDEYFRRHNYVFMLAPHYHPALKNIGRIRRELKVPTIFNLVGPLINPADPEYQVIGISRTDRLELIARVVQKIGKKNITVYSSRDGYDEISSRGVTDCIQVLNSTMRRFTVDPAEFFSPFDMPVVSDIQKARELLLKGISGDSEELADIFALNAALALSTMGRGPMKKCFTAAREQIASGKVVEKMNDMGLQ